MIKNTVVIHKCSVCHRDSIPLNEMDILDSVRFLENLGWTMTEKGADHFMRCPYCTAALDAEEEKRMS